MKKLYSNKTKWINTVFARKFKTRRAMSLAMASSIAIQGTARLCDISRSNLSNGEKMVECAKSVIDTINAMNKTMEVV